MRNREWISFLVMFANKIFLFNTAIVIALLARVIYAKIVLDLTTDES